MLDTTTIYVAAVLFLATLIRSALGFGEALIAVPLLALLTPVAVAAPLAVLISIVVAGVIVAQDWSQVDLSSATGLVISSLFGIPLGLLLLTRADDHTVKLVLGLVIVVFSIYCLTGRTLTHLAEDHTAWLVACGFVSGILGGAYGMNGPPLVIYGALRRWPPQRFRATLQGYFLPASIAGAIGYAWIGLWDGAVIRYALWSLPGVAVAIVLGRSLNSRLRGADFFRVVFAGLLVLGVALLFQAIRREPVAVR